MCTSPERGRRSQRGMTLVELVISLALAGLVISGVFSAWTLLARGGADPMVTRQSLAVAQSLLREIEMQPLPGTATAAASMPGRTGYASILDYNTASAQPVTDAEGTPVAGLAGYSTQVSVATQGLAGVPTGQGYWVLVTVTGPNGRHVKLGQWRSVRGP